MPKLAKYLPGQCAAVPALGEDLQSFAVSQKLPMDRLIHNLLFNGAVPQIPLTVVGGQKQAFTWVSGHGINASRVDLRGPRKEYETAIVGKCLGREEILRGYLFAGKSGGILKRFLIDAGFAKYDSIYLTNLLKTSPLQKGKWQKGWVKQQSPLLRTELLLARPKYVLALGKEVCGYFLGKDHRISDIEKRWFDIVWDARVDEDEEEDETNQYRFQVLACMHPAALEYEATAEDEQRIRDTIKEFGRVVLKSGQIITDVKYPEYPVLRSVNEIRNWLDECPRWTQDKLVAVDAEWQGSHPNNAGSYMRCIQFGAAPGKAVVLELTDKEGNPTLRDDSGVAGEEARDKCFEAIKKVFTKHELRVAGYYFPADLEWLCYFGLNLAPWYEAADSIEECRTKGGFAVELAVAAVDELSRNNLDAVRWRYTDYPQYEFLMKDKVKAIKEEAKKLANRKTATEEDHRWLGVVESGFGWIDSDQLYPYAGGDADVTIRAAWQLTKELDADRFGNNCWEPYYHALVGSLVAAEIMQVGLPTNPQTLLRQSLAYSKKLREIIQRVQDKMAWPGFNPDSPQQVVEMMYGQRYSTRFKDGKRLSVRPPGARTMALEPVLDNDSRSPKEWKTLVESGQSHLHTPGTNAKTIGVIANSSEGVAIRRFNLAEQRTMSIRVKEVECLTDVRDMRALSQLCKTFVGKSDWETKDIWIAGERLQSTEFQWVNGLAPLVCDDGYLRCAISQVKETGRWSASRPNLHATPKRKEARYEKICGDDYPGPVRSAFESPPGFCIVEADYKTAELFMLALASGDKALWEHCQCSLLPDDHPDYMDVHASVAVNGLHFDCKPTKAGLKSIGKAYFRDVAKCYVSGEMLGTESGWIAIEQIVDAFSDGEESTQVDDQSLLLQSDLQGQLTPLQAVHLAGEKMCAAICSTSGLELRVSYEHKTWVWNQWEGLQLKATSGINRDDFLLVQPEVVVEDPLHLVVNKKIERVFNSILENPGPKVSASLLGLLCGLNAISDFQRDGSRCVIDLGPRINREHADAKLRHLSALEGKVPIVDRSGRSAIFVKSEVTELLAEVRRLGWKAVPDVVFTWGKQCRRAFVDGLLLAWSRGSSRWPCVVSQEKKEGSEEHLRKLQQLLLTVGIRTNRDGPVLSPASDQMAKVWSGIIFGNPVDVCTASESLPGYLLDKWLRGVGLPTQQPVAEDAGQVAYRRRISRGEYSDRLDGLLNRSHSLAIEDREQLQNFVSLVNNGFVFEPVDCVRHLGSRICYDVQTSDERQHRLIAGGILSSNSIVFGWAYGRQPPAIVIQAKEEGIVITLAEAEAIVGGLGRTYHRAAEYLEESARRVREGWLCTPLGRYRRVPKSTDRRTLSQYEREFKNTPIQGGVADVVNLAGHNLRVLRRETGVPFWIAMQVHDAYVFLLECKHLKRFLDEVVFEAMSRRIPIQPKTLDGVLRKDLEPQFMSVDAEVFFKWGVKPTEEELWLNGINPKWLK